MVGHLRLPVLRYIIMSNRFYVFCVFIEKEPRDHVAENVRRMRQIQRKCRQKQREDESTAPVPVKALWKSQKYESVPSKLAELLEVT